MVGSLLRRPHDSTPRTTASRAGMGPGTGSCEQLYSNTEDSENTLMVSNKRKLLEWSEANKKV